MKNLFDSCWIALLKIISIQSAKRYCDLNASSTLRFKPNRIISKILWENLDLLQITPAPPAKTIGKAIISSPEITRKSSGLFFNSCIVLYHIARSFFMATTFAKSLAKRTTVEGNILLAVLPGTLYKITGIGDASATALKC
jgi:hypothetical protein